MGEGTTEVESIALHKMIKVKHYNIFIKRSWFKGKQQLQKAPSYPKLTIAKRYWHQYIQMISSRES